MFHFISASGGQVIKGTTCSPWKSEWAEFSSAVEGPADTYRICSATGCILKLKVSIIDPLDWFTR